MCVRDFSIKFYSIFWCFRLGKRTCLSSMRYLPSTVSNASPDQSFSPSHRLGIICSCIQRPKAPGARPRGFFSGGYRNQRTNVDFWTPFYCQVLTRSVSGWKSNIAMSMQNHNTRIPLTEIIGDLRCVLR